MIVRPFINKWSSARCLAALVAGLLLLTTKGYADNGTPLRLVQTIKLPEVQGRIDHMAVDLAGKRIFVAALGNNSLEVIDLNEGKHLRRITGLDEPQGILYLPEFQKLLVTNGGDGTLRVFDGNSLALLDTVKFSKDADNIRYEPQAQQVYVGFGDGALGVVDAKRRQRNDLLEKVENLGAGALSLHGIDIVEIYQALTSNIQLGVGHAVPAKYIPEHKDIK